MIKCSIFYGKKVIILGMGHTGIGAAKSLIASGAQAIALDDNPAILAIAKMQCPQLVAVELNEINWKEIDYLISSPGVPLYSPAPHPAIAQALQHNIKIISDIDILYLACPNAKYIGITGTNGKSTTTALITHVLQQNNQKVQVGGNIGVSVLELAPQEDGLYVLELSSYQLDLISFIYFDTAVITNISLDHIDRHGSFERYVAAKFKIIERLQSQGKAILSLDYPQTKNLKSLIPPIYISNKESKADILIKDRILYDKTRSLKFSFKDYADLPGLHNEENIAAAYTACVTQGIDPDLIVKAIKTFKGLDHRIQTIYKSSRYTFINDSKATNADAAEKALKCYSNIYWIAGGIAKEGGITSLINLIEKNVALTLLIGEAQNEFSKTLKSKNIPHMLAGTLEQALEYLKNIANANGIVLLSPACASMDQFRNYEHRGEEFKRLVIEKFSDD